MPNFFRRLLTDLLWALIGLPVLCLIGGVFMILGGGASIYSVLMSMLTLMMLAYAMRMLRRQRAAAVLGYLEQAVRLNLPLPEILTAAALGEPGALAQRLNGIRGTLEEGQPLSVALLMQVPELPWRSLDLIASAEQAGTLPATLRQLLDEYRPRGSANEAVDTMLATVYPLMVVIISATVVALYAVIVMPKFERIFRDFGIQLPPLTRRLFSLGNSSLLLLLPVLLIALVFLLLGRSTWEVFRGRRMGGRWQTRDVLSAVPFAGALVRDRALADCCQVLADGLAAGIPAGELLNAIGTLQPWSLRRRVMLWEDCVKGGLSLAEGAREAGMPNLIVGMLNISQQTGNAPATMRFLAGFYAAKFSRTKVVLQGALLPATAIIGGAFVLAVILSVFLPMIALVNRVGKWVP